MSEYPSQDIEINIIAYNKTLSYWHKMGYDYIEHVIGMEDQNQLTNDDIDELIAKRRQECMKIHHDTIRSMSLSVSSQWFNTETNKASGVPTIPVVIKQLIEEYATTSDLSGDADFKKKYKKRLQRYEDTKMYPFPQHTGCVDGQIININ